MTQGEAQQNKQLAEYSQNDADEHSLTENVESAMLTLMACMRTRARACVCVYAYECICIYIHTHLSDF